MDTLRIYNNLCSRAYNRDSIDSETYELHHIVPRSLGGDDDPRNLCLLTVKEHFLAHLLLAYTETPDNKFDSQWQSVATIAQDSTNPKCPRRFAKIRLKKWQRKRIGYYTARCFRMSNLKKARDRFNTTCKRINDDYVNLVLDLAEIEDLPL